MPHIDRYEPGSFCWVELGTTDQSAAKSFYEALFGWKATDFPMGPGSFYTMFQLDGRDAGAAYTLTTELEQGVPPHWMLYVAVASADETAAKVKEAGGKVVAGPFDVATFGRMAVLQDPAGAHFSVWEAKDHFGMGIGGEPNTFCWADLSVPDQETAKKFYSAVFGWEIWEGKEGMGYLHISNGGKHMGGIQPPAHRDPNVPPHWMVYFRPANTDAAVAKTVELGGKVYAGPMTMGGRWAAVADPQGAAFALFTPAGA